MAACTALKSTDTESSADFPIVSVRMGMLRGSCDSADIGLSFRGICHLMRLKGQFLFAISPEPLAPQAQALRIRIEDFGNSREVFQAHRQPVAQIDQKIGRAGRLGGEGQPHWRIRIQGFSVAAILMRYERSVVEGPEQVIEGFRVGSAITDDDHAQVLEVSLLGEPAGKGPALFRRRALQDVKIHSLGHFEWARLTRKSTSKGMGRPVLPFCEPPSQAVPATSKCAHSRSLANFDRNEAAVHAPPSRPPMLARSAKLLFSWSTYSSPIGRRQARSSARMPAAASSSASPSLLLINPLKWLPSAMMQAPVKVATSITAAGL